MRNEKKPGTHTCKLCAKTVDVPRRGGLSEFYSMNVIELPRHSRKATQSGNESALTS